VFQRLDAQLRSKISLLLLAMLGLFVFGACIGGGDDTAQAAALAPSAAQATPTPTPLPADAQASSTPTPTPVPEIAPLVSRADAEGAVLEAIAACTDGVAGGLGPTATGLRLFFDSSFQSLTRSWLIETNTADFAVTFGHWRVNEGGLLQASPVDRIAERIATSGLDCAYPSVLLEADPAPPRFVEPPVDIDPEAAEPVVVNEEPVGPVAIITSPDLAAIRVWSGVYSCSQDFPTLESFIARQDASNIWLVEGRTDVTSYGLWAVDAYTGDVEPRDERAKLVFASCDAGPIAVTGEQASVRVWVATYDCFGSPPPLIAFHAAQESPSRWVVEGRIELVDINTGASLGTTLYGLWLVETDTGAITGLDTAARATRIQDCFQPFL
jgi:hypothetical protein